MALKALLLRRKIDDAEKTLNELRGKDTEFQTREAELETAIGEAQTEEDRSAVESLVDTFEAEKRAHEEQISTLETQLSELRGALEEEEKTQREAMKPPAVPVAGRKDGGSAAMNTRERFMGLSVEETRSIFAQPEVREFIGQVRSIMKRDAGNVTNPQVLIPEVMLPFLRQIVEENTKLLKHTNLQRISGNGRMVVDGGFPEAVWTEMCGTINEGSIGFYDTEISGYKVGILTRICNALLEDSDIALATEVLRKHGQGIGLAIDKAIVYGTGTKMPLGIIPSLAQTEQPADWSATSRPWADLHSTHVVSISAANSSGTKLFEAIIDAAGVTVNKFANAGRWWAMSQKTLMSFLKAGLSINASGALVTAMGSAMPVVGGAIETLDWMPDNVFVGGFDLAYLMAERAGLRSAQSEHRYFTEDQTAFRSTARYDGKPVVREAFVAGAINGGSVSASAVTFAPDTANSTGGSDPGTGG